jgi:hypothetical protein
MHWGRGKVLSPNLFEEHSQRFQAGKPFIDFLNDTIDDYDL